MERQLSTRFWWFAAFVSFYVLAVADGYVVHRNWIVRRETSERFLQNIEDNQSDISEVDSLSHPPPAITSMDIVSDIRLRYAVTRVTSRVSNPAPVAQETTFHIILPETAFISGFLMEVEGKVYKAGLKEKEKAQAEYESAVQSGQSAAQVAVSARDANEFTVSVNLAASSKISFNLTYEELLSRRRSSYEQAIHVSPGSVVPRLSLEVSIAEVLPVTNVKVIPQRSNDLKLDDNKSENADLVKIMRTNETRVSVTYRPSREDQLQKSKEGLQGQFVLQYDVDRSTVEKNGGEIYVVDGYFVHFFAPSSLPVLPKHVIFVLDTSGSMSGQKMEQTKQAMNSILDQLRSEDVFSVVEFSSRVQMWDLTSEYSPPDNWFDENEAPVTLGSVLEPLGKFDDIQAYQVNDQSLKRAKQFVSKMTASGGTNIDDAMQTALKSAQSLQSRIKLTPLIIFLTDGEPTVGETRLEEILRKTRKANSDNAVSIYTLAFGTGADFTFLTKVSTQNRGFARKIYEAADATLQLEGFFDEVASPLLSNVQFVYDNNTNVSDLTETKVANFFRGSETVIAGRIDTKAPSLTVEIDGISAEGSYNNIEDFPIIVDPKFPTPVFPKLPQHEENEKNQTKFSLEKIWAYLTIQELLKKRDASDDKDELAKINEKALSLSLKYGFVTPLTSLVVVKPNEEQTTANVRPAHNEGAPIYVSSLGAPAAAFSPFLALPDPQFLRPQALPIALPFFSTPTRTTSFPSLFTESQELHSPEDGNYVSIEESAVVTASPNYVFSPENFIRQFEHNETHVNMTNGISIISLSWQDELPDEAYQACAPNYSSLAEVGGLCKSIWKCHSITEDILLPSVIERETIDPANACIIYDSYVGICCITIPTSLDREFTTEIPLEITTATDSEIASETTIL